MRASAHRFEPKQFPSRSSGCLPVEKHRDSDVKAVRIATRPLTVSQPHVATPVALFEHRERRLTICGANKTPAPWIWVNRVGGSTHALGFRPTSCDK
ncbi:hypothetical protein CCR75_002488 [Bremia lactucae]|uniref:Uncharacterized protein n=1 Tax=Bremia lactucae TaxID=4779 RepID=A0A976FRA0_BRELC|nr:hypothetical protein CCR75_002488 [Bremia lactucae]